MRGLGGASEGLLLPSAITNGGPIATHALLFPRSERRLRATHFVGEERSAVERPINDAELPELGESLRGERPSAFPLPASLRGESLHGEDSDPYGSIDGPGLYRREHGCVVVRSATTTIMMDPVSGWVPGAPRTRGLGAGGSPDAVLVTHGHADHFHVPSILAQVGDARTPVIVPAVPRPSLLSPSDMAGSLRLMGQRVEMPAWGTRTRIGDIDIEILPFYGEQPLRDAAGPHDLPVEGLRNWGNCYRLTTPQFSVLALIDSGIDPAGTMVEVAARSCALDGPPDFLLTSLPRFYCPFFMGLPHYYLSLSFDCLARLYEAYCRQALPSVTPGPDGVMDICRAACARHYLPYGNGFEGIGRPIVDVGIRMGEPSEAQIVRYLRDRFAAEGLPTGVIGWNCGDHVAVTCGDVTRRAGDHVQAF